MRTAIIFLALAMAFCDVTIRRNVIFRRLDVVSTTDARWLVTFFIDTDPFLGYIERLYSAVNETKMVIVALSKKYNSTDMKPFYQTTLAITKEIDALNLENGKITKRFSEIRSIK